ncbi:hypothetical protein F1737_04060 [Methanoplanus sp. FWC-SCC4]|uniref:S-layer protein n=1 Tax=Methanochimaera problematica TaxID=2609417 RepID=A0AA97I3X5_9EURY|nr:hypothetical protein [Methanoplanus sp. FWC-SCC4]WOF15929.1 hypothetical protein F1737_04060 [Methanoplanus sp. FWC-SCC4]
MRGIYSGIKLITFLILLSVFICAFASAAGIAVTPSKMTIDNAVRGGEYENTIIVFNPNDYPILAEVSVSGDVANWVKVYNENDREEPVSEISIKESNLRLVVVVNVPDDAVNGIHNAKVNIETKSSKDSSGNVGATLKVRATSSINVDVSGIEIKDGVCDYIKISDSEVDYPVPINFVFKNTGNVVISPEISVTVKKDGSIIDTFSKITVPVKPGVKEEILEEWENKGLESGDYVAVVAVSVDGKVIKKEESDFKLIPKGTFSRQGEFKKLTYEGTATAGKITKIIGTFVNTGEISTKAKLAGEIYKDGSLDSTFETDDLMVSVLDTEDLVYYFKPEESGEYTVKAVVNYEGKKTDEKEVSLTITGQNSLTSSDTKKSESQAPVGVITIVGSIIFAICLIYGRKQN